MAIFLSLSLSMYIEQNENNYDYYRDLIYKYVYKNKNLLKEFFEHLTMKLNKIMKIDIIIF